MQEFTLKVIVRADFGAAQPDLAAVAESFRQHLCTKVSNCFVDTIIVDFPELSDPLKKYGIEVQHAP